MEVKTLEFGKKKLKKVVKTIETFHPQAQVKFVLLKPGELKKENTLKKLEKIIKNHKGKIVVEGLTPLLYESFEKGKIPLSKKNKEYNEWVKHQYELYKYLKQLSEKGNLKEFHVFDPYEAHPRYQEPYKLLNYIISLGEAGLGYGSIMYSKEMYSKERENKLKENNKEELSSTKESSKSLTRRDFLKGIALTAIGWKFMIEGMEKFDVLISKNGWESLKHNEIARRMIQHLKQSKEPILYIGTPKSKDIMEYFSRFHKGQISSESLETPYFPAYDPMLYRYNNQHGRYHIFKLKY